MDLRKTILKEHSKSNCDRIVKWIGNSQRRFDELIFLFLNDEYRVVQRAAWPLSYAAMKYPGLMKNNFGKLIRNLRKPGLPVAVKRNTVRLLQYIPIPKRFHGELMSQCFEYLTSENETVAVKVFSMTILANLSKVYPEIKPELKLILEEHWDQKTAGFKSRAKKILKTL
jgi:hypothetical protein